MTLVLGIVFLLLGAVALGMSCLCKRYPADEDLAAYADHLNRSALVAFLGAAVAFVLSL